MSQMSGDFMYEQPKASSNTLGLVGFILAFCLSPIGLLLSLIGLTKSPRGFAIAGVIVGLVGTAIWGVLGYGAYFVGTVALGAKKSADALTAVQTNIEGAKSAAGEYPADLTAIAANVDAFGNPFVYERSADKMGYLLTSKGKDGQSGTPDDVSTIQGVTGDLNIVLASMGAGGGLFGSAGGGQAGQGIQLATHMMLIQMALDNEQKKSGSLPESLDKTTGLVSSLLTDPWGSAFVYTRSSDGQSFELRSNGPDKAPGTADDQDSKKITGDFNQIQKQAKQQQQQQQGGGN